MGKPQQPNYLVSIIQSIATIIIKHYSPFSQYPSGRRLRAATLGSSSSKSRAGRSELIVYVFDGFASLWACLGQEW